MSNNLIALFDPAKPNCVFVYKALEYTSPCGNYMAVLAIPQGVYTDAHSVSELHRLFTGFIDDSQICCVQSGEMIKSHVKDAVIKNYIENHNPSNL